VKAWKQFEADAAALFNGKRFWANSGERLDFEGEIYRHHAAGVIHDLIKAEASVTHWMHEKVKVRGQCKLVKSLSLEALTKLAEEPGVDVVCVKVRRGTGKPSPALVVMTFENYKRLHG
jgi:hypothetical protein